MSGIRKSTDFGLTNAERKSLRETEAQEAMSDHDDAENAFHENRERLRTTRLVRESANGPILYPAPALPDETPVDNVRFSTRITNALNAAGVKTIGEIRQASDATLLSFQNLGASSIAHLREALGQTPGRAPKPKGSKPGLNPAIAATSKPGQFEGNGVVPARELKSGATPPGAAPAGAAALEKNRPIGNVRPTTSGGTPPKPTPKPLAAVVPPKTAIVKPPLPPRNAVVRPPLRPVAARPPAPRPPGPPPKKPGPPPKKPPA